jgi:membrane-associated protein
VDAIRTLIDFILHLDTHLTELVSSYGGWTYAILFLIVFAETGLVVTPFLPGDSLLFATGALAATSALDIRVLFVLLLVAAIIGDAVNYAVGKRIGVAAAAGKVWGVKPAYIQRTHEFYEKYGGKTIIIARFVPIVRTFAPFVAGAGSMTYRRFAIYNVTGALLWVGSMLFAGYWFGNLPIVRDNFGLVVIAIIVLSVLPAVYEIVRHRLAKRSAAADATRAG